MASALTEVQVVPLARRILQLQPLRLTLAARFAIQDVFWAADGFPEIPKKGRRELERSLNRGQQLPTCVRANLSAARDFQPADRQGLRCS